MALAAESDFEGPPKQRGHYRSAHGEHRSLRWQIPFVFYEIIFAATDTLCILFASVLGALGYQLLASDGAWNLDLHIGAGVAGATLYVLIRLSFGSYHITEILSTRRDPARILSQWLLTLLLLTSLAFIFRIGAQFSRGSIAYFGLAGFALLLASRALMKVGLRSALRRGRVQGRRVVVFGLHNELETTQKSDLLTTFGMTEVGRVPVAPAAAWDLIPSSEIATSLERVLDISRNDHAEEIVLALGWDDTQKIDLVRQFFHLSPLPLRLLPDQKVRYLAASGELNRALSIEIKRAPLSNLDRATKRVLDVGVAFLGLIILLPLMLIVALAIKLDSPGPIFFRQQRIGFNSKPFSIFKFRSMKVMENGDSLKQAKRSDPRVTRVGRFLRKTSIDELPQLINVLQGDMSVVGPRPHAIVHDSLYGKQLSEYAYRHHVKPGITGLAQINGSRGETPQLKDMERRLELDLRYISNWRLGWDIAILFKTVVVVSFNRDVY